VTPGEGPSVFLDGNHSSAGPRGYNLKGNSSCDLQGLAMNNRRASGQIEVLCGITRELLVPDREPGARLEAAVELLANYLGVDREAVTIHDTVGTDGRPAGPSLPAAGMVRAPIIAGRELVGELSVGGLARPGSDPEEDRQFLTVAASLFGDAVRDRRDRRADAESLRHEDRRLEERAGECRPANMVGRSRQILQVFELIRQAAPFETTVLIRGECGTGKELVARAIHVLSQRRHRPFVAVDCGALPEHLAASELFGHVRGAYAGVEADRRGRFEQAHGGTIFLDEVGELIPAVQVKLLRVLQEGEIERLGDERPRRIDVRIVAATNARVEKAIAVGRFREDLYYRLNAFPIDLAPLRDRKSDIPLLADHFLQVYARKHRKRVLRISPPALELLAAYHWPGNVRELENAIGRAVLLAEDGVIRDHHLPPALQSGNSPRAARPGSLSARMRAYEREILVAAMKDAGGNQTRAAKALATTPRILGYRLRRHGLLPGSVPRRHPSPAGEEEA
jgi:Nif-specific regulatory protein